ncbi:sugar transferase [Halobacillus sp. ACCC02827]|uniref:sugar transferase n=1 Tax=Halobacillus sp. ACCC02827 TaxID=3052090 RepID=UPI00257084A6|nr:sugar transferase [Halobacillus sp. ACCC02827]WJE15272.1 sugar transferase [Halobacillus sp. ACCC02827]
MKVSELTQFNESYSLEQQINNQKSYDLAKRMFDVVCSCLAIVILSILFLSIAIAIKVEDPKGKIFFSQIRVGKNGKKFKMFKFRSMVHDAEERLKELYKYNEVSGAMFKMKNDPRVTNIGKFIRKTSLDELPQLINVIIGDMSLVGPRPQLVSEVAEYDSHHSKRLLVTPGCTGLWQATDRNSVGFEEMVKLDLYYIRNRSFFFDIRILIQTLKILLKPNTAS